MKSLRITALYILDKVSKLLTTEPARLIGYGAAVIVALVAQFLSHQGFVRFDGVTFEDALLIVMTAITFVVTLVESIRRFVFSPMTYIEDVSDEARIAHETAHMEDDLRAFMQSMTARAEEPSTAAVGTVKAKNASDRLN